MPFANEPICFNLAKQYRLSFERQKHNKHCIYIEQIYNQEYPKRCESSEFSLDSIRCSNTKNGNGSSSFSVSSDTCVPSLIALVINVLILALGSCPGISALNKIPTLSIFMFLVNASVTVCHVVVKVPFKMKSGRSSLTARVIGTCVNPYSPLKNPGIAIFPLSRKMQIDGI